MSPQFGVPNFGIPNYDQMQAAFNSIGQQQQMWYNNQYQQFQIFCQTRGLNPSDPNAFNLFYNQLVSNMGHQQLQSPQVFPQPQQPQIFPQPQQPQIFPNLNHLKIFINLILLKFFLNLTPLFSNSSWYSPWTRKW